VSSPTPRGAVTVLHGPNLNLLGTREPALYGRTTLAELDAQLVEAGRELGLTLDCRQSNHEGLLVDWIQACREEADVLILNAGGYTHTSVALRDAVAAIAPRVPMIEVHLTVPEAREPFRHVSLLAGVARGRIEGFGVDSYLLALRAASALIRARGVDNRDQ
jgi:3-dehydroquinate dehydratase-2